MWQVLRVPWVRDCVEEMEKHREGTHPGFGNAMDTVPSPLKQSVPAAGMEHARSTQDKQEQKAPQLNLQNVFHKFARMSKAGSSPTFDEIARASEQIDLTEFLRFASEYKLVPFFTELTVLNMDGVVCCTGAEPLSG